MQRTVPTPLSRSVWPAFPVRSCSFRQCSEALRSRTVPRHVRIRAVPFPTHPSAFYAPDCPAVRRCGHLFLYDCVEQLSVAVGYFTIGRSKNDDAADFKYFYRFLRGGLRFANGCFGHCHDSDDAPFLHYAEELCRRHGRVCQRIVLFCASDPFRKIFAFNTTNCYMWPFYREAYRSSF